MKKATKTLLLMLCAVVLVVSSVLGTVAYLTSEAKVENTFSVGNVTITMDESTVDAYGVKTSGTTTNNSYKLIPGHKYIKDPTIHVAQKSEPCWLFAKIDNELSGITEIDMETGWVEIETGVYAYLNVVDARGTQQDQTIFKTFTVNDDFSYDATYEGKKIIVTGYAVQANGFEAADDTDDAKKAAAIAAWDATFGAPQNP